MKFIQLPILAAGLLLLCSCTVFDTKRHSGQASMMPPNPLVLPVNKNWQVIEEPPKLSNERERLPFQMEQSVQPEGTTKLLSPEEKRKIETTR
jgi:predicted RNA methylase